MNFAVTKPHAAMKRLNIVETEGKVNPKDVTKPHAAMKRLNLDKNPGVWNDKRLELQNRTRL